MEKITLNIEGMHCPSCEMLIGDSLKELDGVKKAEIDHKSGLAKVEFDKSKTTKQAIINIIKEGGYKVRK